MVGMMMRSLRGQTLIPPCNVLRGLWQSLLAKVMTFVTYVSWLDALPRRVSLQLGVSGDAPLRLVRMEDQRLGNHAKEAPLSSRLTLIHKFILIPKYADRNGPLAFLGAEVRLIHVPPTHNGGFCDRKLYQGLN